MNSLFTIDIPKRQAQCAGKGERFVPEMEIFSLLTEEESKKIVRRDFCATCWPQFQQEAQLPHSRGYWKSKIEKKKKISDASRAEQALMLLRLLLNTPEGLEAEIFVLCLFLAHARYLALRKEVQKENGVYDVYELLKQNEWITIKRVQVSQLEIDKIQHSLALKLQTMMN